MVWGHEGLVRRNRGGRLGVLRHWGKRCLWVRGHGLQTLVVGMLIERMPRWEVARSTLGQVVWPEVGWQAGGAQALGRGRLVGEGTLPADSGSGDAR